MKTVAELTGGDIKPMALSADMRDFVDRTFIFHDIKHKDSKHGVIIIATVSQTEDGEHGELFMRGEKVYERLNYLKEKELFPCKGTIKKVGKAWELE